MVTPQQLGEVDIATQTIEDALKDRHQCLITMNWLHLLGVNILLTEFGKIN